ncbi:ATP synthase subunit I [Jeotgalibacillus proteolyticus]|uniref:ATP synthase subunit n=1 Tax=Jeotgalibacillus proteolyticus TaxID=2082395 RepID=A0A2S5G9E6_9BACL|nr:ATP synthase subunit I [Jeotgalibacillus proteolyticus]PPA69599.1 ATP synthase subunit [Jeotgalibacillus proteolyticus]
MPDLKQHFQRYTKYILYLLSIFVLGWGFTPYPSVFLGLILGTSLSLFNLWLIRTRMERFDRAIDEGKKVRSLGTFSRMASAGVAVLIALEFPEFIHLISTVFGLMMVYFVIMIDYFWQQIILHMKREER